MLTNLLTSSMPEGYQEISIGTAALYALIGQLVVFAGIAFLVLVVWLVGRFLTKTSNVKPGVTVKPAQPVAKTEITPVSQTEEISEETVAVIMAALTAYYESQNPKCAFTVKRIKRI